MIPKLRWYERFIGWLLFRIEARDGLAGGFDDIDRDAMQWFVEGDHMRYGRVCCLMQDYVYYRIAREFEKAAK